MDPRETFRNRIPQRAFATDTLKAGLSCMKADHALRRAFVQANWKHSVSWLLYDVDRDGAAIDWDDRGAPPPNLVAINLDNGHAHLFYGLETPVHDYLNASPKALRYMAAVDVGMTDKLGADRGYSKLLTKNPLHARWKVFSFRLELYDLAELADYVELNLDRRRKIDAVGLGRNCQLFETLRLWAYRERRQPYLSEEIFFDRVRQRAYAINAGFNPPLPHSEVRATSKSVSRWTWRNMDTEGFRQWQRAVSQKAANKRRETASALREKILRKRREWPEVTQTDLAAMFGVTRRTISNHLRAAGMTGEKSPISDNTPY